MKTILALVISPISIVSVIVALLAIVLVIILWSKLVSLKKDSSGSYQKMHSKLNRVENDKKALLEKILKEEQKVDQHREELLSQTEHLQQLNFELERLSLVASKTDTAVIIADANKNITWVNKGFEKLYGYTLDSLKDKIGTNIDDFSVHDDISDMLDIALKNKESLNYNSKAKTISGKDVWVNTVMNPIYDENDQIASFIILDTDVSDMQKINDELKKLSLVASNTSNSVIIFNGKHEIDWVNEGFYLMYGYSKLEYIDKFGLTLTDFMQLNGKSDVLQTIIESKSSLSFVATVTNRAEKSIWKQITLTPICNDENDELTFIVVESDITPIKEAEHRVQEEKKKVDDLLLNILPEETAEELKSKGSATPRFYRSASVLFADIQDFTKLAEDLTPAELVEALQLYFSHFDDVATDFFIEKIKTMGDAFLCVGGIPMRNKSHPFDTILAALELQRIMSELGIKREESGRRAWQLRIGIHTGPIVAGVVGKQKMTYDIWGDSVNIAKRIESACVPGMVNVSVSTYETIKDYFECEHRGKILAKHKGHIDMYFVHRIKPEFSVDGNGLVPNSYFKEMMSQL